MKLKSIVHLALAETRRSRGTLSFCVFSIALGVLSLTAIRSITDSLRGSIAGQARQLLGADISMSSNQPLDSGTAAEIGEELTEAGARSVLLTQFYSMLSATGNRAGQNSRLVRVRAVGDGYPFYGRIDTDPAQQFEALDRRATLVADPSLLRELRLSPGDTVRLGQVEFELAAALVKTPGSPTAEFSLAPAVYIHEKFLPETRLIATGSRASYRRLFALPDGADPEEWKERVWQRAIDANITVRTSRESAANVQRFLRRLSRFLTVVGLVTLLLGALGIGSAMNAFMRGKLDNAAVLRCIGARPRDLFQLYSGVALLVGSIGSVIGAVLGSLVPFVLAGVVDALGAEYLPVGLELAPSAAGAVHGLAAGIAATFVFATVPVVRVAQVAPLRVLRRAADGLGRERGRGRATVVALGAVAAFGFVFGLTAVETESLPTALYFTAAVVISIGALAGVSRLAMWSARRLLGRVSSYHVRQGIANLYRPGNQTGSVVTALGTGILLLGSILIIQTSLKETIAIESREELPNLFIIDIQPDQHEGVAALIGEARGTRTDIAPMISARILALNGKMLDRSGVERDATQRSFEDRMRTREYFVTYRTELLASEELTAGALWDGRPAKQEASIDERLAENLGAELGDTLTLDVQGVPIDTVVTSFRRIRWQAMRPNAMIVLSPGEIENAPKMFVAATRVAEEKERYALQDALVSRFPNLSVVDITDAAATVRLILERVSTVFSLLGLLAILTGSIILGGAIASGRFARQRESMLLKVLGAGQKDLRRILIAEYGCLAIVGTACGWLLAEAVTRPALGLLFRADTVVPYGALSAIAAGAVVLNVGVGVLIGRSVSRQRPLDVLRAD